ncbi:MAG: 16S rRNA (cytosine(1402)-N(4))-methyltransferase RsmH [Chloroflexia bacterium]
MTTTPLHTSVLPEEVVEALAVRPGGVYVDCTLGAAGHATRVLDASAPDGRLLGLDADNMALDAARDRLNGYGDRAVLVHTNFRRLREAAQQHGFVPADGVLFDLGLSSVQLDVWDRGFSFRRDEPLDMRFDPTQGPTAADLLAELSEDDLARLIWEYGEEPAGRRIARAVAAARGEIQTTGRLAELVTRASHRPRGRTHPATRTFQALRIAVNDELGALRDGLEAAVEILAPGGRLAVISFHSLEDRIVKHFIRDRSLDCVCPPKQPICTCDTVPTLRPLGRRAARAGLDETTDNPRSRSARLRFAEKI